MTRTLWLALWLAGCTTHTLEVEGGPDNDGDGYGADADCNNHDSTIHPAAEEIPGDGIDQDCDGLDGDDADGDGYGAEEDCDDDDPDVNPGAEDAPYDGVDADCDGADDYDADGDGWVPDGVGYTGDLPTGDCDDTDATVNPEAVETCNGVDDDCDDAIDEDPTDEETFYADADSDGYGDPETTTTGCEAPEGYVSDDTDCDDTTASTRPGAAEQCDGIDNDCDGEVDDDVTERDWYADTDADGYGDADSAVTDCKAPSGYVEDGTDCDDTAPTVHPGADETCNEVDDDCDGTVDEDDATDALTWYADADADGYGDASTTTEACEQPTGYVADGTDCDDTDAAVSPAADESCDGVDNDCDGDADEGDAIDASTWYADADGDGYGDASSTTNACDQPTGHVSDATDCDDTDASVSPGATETCNAVDDDCDGVIDEDDASDASTWYADVDGDGWGDASSTTTACDQPTGYVSDATDCDDTNGSVSPGGTETCDNGVDDDCDALLDCEDGDCTGDATCVETACADGLDDDADGLTDCADEDCWGLSCHPAGVESWVTGGSLTRVRQHVDSMEDCGSTTGSSDDSTLAWASVSGKARVVVPTSMGASSIATCDWTVGSGGAVVGGAAALTDLWRSGATVTSGCRLAGTSWMPQALHWDDTGDRVAFHTASGAGSPWYAGTLGAATSATWTSSSTFVAGSAVCTRVRAGQTWSYVYGSLGGNTYTASP